MDKKRTIMPNGRYTDDELNLLKSVFAEDLPLIKILRKVMLQLPMTEAEEMRWHNTFKGEELNDLMAKFFLPQIDGDAPVGQIVDLWMTLNLENKMPEEEQSLIKSRELVINYIGNQLNVLKGEGKNDIVFASLDISKGEVLKARSAIIMHIENQLATISGLAGYKAETSEETIKRLNQNSAK